MFSHKMKRQIDKWNHKDYFLVDQKHILENAVYIGRNQTVWQVDHGEWDWMIGPMKSKFTIIGEFVVIDQDPWQMFDLVALYKTIVGLKMSGLWSGHFVHMK